MNNNTLDFTTVDNNTDMNSLLDYIDALDAEDANLREDKNLDTYSIQDDSTADYYIRQYKKTQNEIEDAQATAKKAIQAYTEKVESWLSKTTNSLENKQFYFQTMLENYAHAKLDGTKKKSLRLIEGSIGFHKQQPQYIYDDNVLAATLDSKYLKPVVNKALLKKDGVIRNGQFYLNDVPISGVTIEERDKKFVVK